jgi:hypothetical protein
LEDSSLFSKIDGSCLANSSIASMNIPRQVAVLGVSCFECSRILMILFDSESN